MSLKSLVTDRQADTAQGAEMLKRIDQQSVKLNEYLRVNNGSKDMSRLTDDITNMVAHVKELSRDMAAMRTELRTPSPSREFRSSTPTRGMQGSESIAIINHILELNKSMSVLRNQVTDLSLLNNSQ